MFFEETAGQSLYSVPEIYRRLGTFGFLLGIIGSIMCFGFLVLGKEALAPTFLKACSAAVGVGCLWVCFYLLPYPTNAWFDRKRAEQLKKTGKCITATVTDVDVDEVCAVAKCVITDEKTGKSHTVSSLTVSRALWCLNNTVRQSIIGKPVKVYVRKHCLFPYLSRNYFVDLMTAFQAAFGT